MLPTACYGVDTRGGTAGDQLTSPGTAGDGANPLPGALLLEVHTPLGGSTSVANLQLQNKAVLLPRTAALLSPAMPLRWVIQASFCQ